MELFKLLGIIAVDNSEANKAIKETTDAAKGAGDELGDAGSKASSKFGGAMKTVGKGAVAVGKTVVTGLGVAAGALGGLTVKALSAAGELEQNMGGSEAVFKDHAGKMQETAKTAFSNMGLSASDFLGTANKMGALFQGAGFGIEESATMSADAMQRAADVASIMGIDTSAAMEAIAGAAKGNFTMMDNLGVAMNDTTIQAYALSKGIDKSTQDMTNQEKIGLAMEMFMEKTAYAAGNYAKENETLAGSLGTAKAALSNFLSGAGTVEDVVSSFSNAANVIVKNINTMFPALMTGITQLVNQIVPLIPPLLKQLLPGLISGAVGLINGLVAAMPQIVTALMSALPALIQGVMQIVNALIAALPQIMQAIVAALPMLIPPLVNGLVSMIVMLCTMLPQIIQPIIDNLPTIIASICGALMANLPALIQGVIALVGGLIKALPQVLNALLQALIQGVGAILDAVFSYCGTSLSEVWNIMKSAFEKAVNWIKNKVQKGFDLVKKYIIQPISDAKNKAVEAFNNLKKKVSDVASNIKNTVSKKFEQAKEAMTKPIQKARDTIKGIVDKIKGFFSGLKLKFPNIKLPHFKVKPEGWEIGDLLKGSIPKLSIDWYAKAMRNPQIMNEPTVFGYDAATGRFQGGGEAGSEVVTGTGTLMSMIRAAVSSENGAIVYYLQKLVEILAKYFPEILASMGQDIVLDDGTLVAKLAPGMDKALGQIRSRKDRGR